MKIQGSKKTLIVILAIFVVLCILIFIFLVRSQVSKSYPKEPIRLKNLGVTTQNIDISEIKDEREDTDIPIYFVERKVHISNVETFISKLQLSLTRADVVKDSYIEWSNGKNKFTYDGIIDSLTFQLQEGIDVNRGAEGFSSVFSTYFNQEYKYIVTSENKNASTGTTYYASRLLEDIPVENGFGYEYTDTLTFDKNGKLVSGKLFLGEITKYDLFIPLIKDTDLKRYINSSNYPKERYLDTSILQSTLSISYLSDEWEDIENTAENCKASDRKVIFVFKNTDQGYLLPIYKIDASCTVKYKENSYSVPAIFYVNAGDPDYITTE